jgi:hypothetical protein
LFYVLHHKPKLLPFFICNWLGGMLSGPKRQFFCLRRDHANQLLLFICFQSAAADFLRTIVVDTFKLSLRGK